MNQENRLIYEGLTAYGYHVYRNAEGFLEGYKAYAKMKTKNVTRIVSKETTVAGFEKFLRGVGKRHMKVKDIPLKPGQLQSLFP